jgi:UDP-N-acetylmuramate-alanine ligase
VATAGSAGRASEIAAGTEGGAAPDTTRKVMTSEAVAGRALARAMRIAGKVDPLFVEDVGELAAAIGEQVCDGDVVIAMGAGTIGGVAQQLVDSFGAANGGNA